MSTYRTIRMRAVAALAAAAVASAAFAGNMAGAAAPPRPAGPPTQLLEQRMHGEAAIRALDARLPDAASRNGISADELRRRLRSDDMLAVSEDGTLVFVDQGLADHAEPAASEVTDPAWLSRSPADALTLHSRPGASRVINLDFDGHDPSTSAWTDKTDAQPWDTDGNPSTFSDAERRMIIEVWQRVAEDFAPFAIDVTTQDPGVDAIRRTDAADETYGTRVVVTPTAANCSGCGGVAYVGTFDSSGGSATQGWTHDRYQPAFVYPGGDWSAKSIAEAASHEAGHNLGLSHDATASTGYYSGHGDWAPIMGVGYYEPISQWSRGEYAGANNTEDDFAVVAANGGPLSADDHGGTAATATPLSPTVDLVGEIGTSTDVDAFSFTTAGGLLGVAATPASVGANLDVGLRLVRDDGTVVADVDGAGLSSTLDLSIGAGTYAVVVDGVGAGDPATTGYSDYGSVGRYRLTGSLPATDVNRAPTAVVQASATSGTAPLPVTFDGRGSSDPDGTPLSHSWAFGDGTTASGAMVTHTFPSAGTYAVTLTVTDGTLSATATTTITVGAPPTAVVPDEPTLTATAANGAVTLDWGDDPAATAYDVYRETRHKSGAYRSRTLLTTTTGTVSTWVDRPGAGTFRYQVVARSSAGSATSNPVVVTVASSRTKPGRTSVPR